MATGVRRPPARDIRSAAAGAPHRPLGTATTGGKAHLGRGGPSGTALVFRHRCAFSHAGGRLRGAFSGIALPRPAAWAAIALQAVLCWPTVMDWREGRHSQTWRLNEFPIAAALRIIPESDYVAPRVDGYSLAQLIERETPPGAKILALTDVANAYSTRDVRIWWQSAEADRLADSLRAAAFASEGGLFVWKAEWPPESVGTMRVSVPAASAAEFDIADLRLFFGYGPGSSRPRRLENSRVAEPVGSAPGIGWQPADALAVAATGGCRNVPADSVRSAPEDLSRGAVFTCIPAGRH